MTELTLKQGHYLADLFAYTEETLAKSFVQGCMGRGWADKLPDPACGMIELGCFWLVAGDHTLEAARELISSIEIDPRYKSALVIPQNENWGALLGEVYGERASKFTRYAIKKEPDVFDRERLEGFVAALPEGYSLRQIDGELYHRVMADPFTYEYCAHFGSEEDYLSKGLGFCVMLGDEIIGGASSYSVYREGIEIEISIREAHRRKGLATAVAAKLILTCLDRGLYPSWDAANTNSVALAEKLGYHFSHEYDTYVIR
jgi:GNAT superfamily N-acetyltransferase